MLQEAVVRGPIAGRQRLTALTAVPSALLATHFFCEQSEADNMPAMPETHTSSSTLVLYLLYVVSTQTFNRLPSESLLSLAERSPVPLPPCILTAV